MVRSPPFEFRPAFYNVTLQADDVTTVRVQLLADEAGGAGAGLADVAFDAQRIT